MVLDLDRQPFGFGVGARAFGYGPALERAAHLEAEVEVGLPSRMFLDDEATRGRRATLPALRFRRAGEISLRAVLLEVAHEREPNSLDGTSRSPRQPDGFP